MWNFSCVKPRQHRNDILKYACKATKQEDEDTETVNVEIVLEPWGNQSNRKNNITRIAHCLGGVGGKKPIT